MHQAALLVPLLLVLSVPFHRTGMRLAVAFPIIGMILAPLMAAVQADLPVEGDRRRSSGGGNRAGGASGSRFGSKRIGWGDKGKVGRVAGSSDRDDRSFRWLR